MAPKSQRLAVNFIVGGRYRQICRLNRDITGEALDVSKKSNLKKVKSLVAIANPTGPRKHVTRARAQIFIEAGVAKFDSVGRLVMLLTDPQVVARKQLKGGSLKLVIVPEFDGMDAFPGRPVLPPSPKARQRAYGGPLRPPLVATQRTAVEV